MVSEEVDYYSVDEMVEVVKNHMPFIRGITVSGGEATLYHKYLAELFRRVHALELSCYVDSNGFFDIEQIADLVDETDKFLFDIKGGIGPSLKDLCFSEYLLTNQKINQGYEEDFGINHEHLENLKRLLEIDKIEEVRLVYVKGYYDPREVVDYISKALMPYPQVSFKIIRLMAKDCLKTASIN